MEAGEFMAPSLSGTEEPPREAPVDAVGQGAEWETIQEGIDEWANESEPGSDRTEL